MRIQTVNHMQKRLATILICVSCVTIMSWGDASAAQGDVVREVEVERSDGKRIRVQVADLSRRIDQISDEQLNEIVKEGPESGGGIGMHPRVWTAIEEVGDSQLAWRWVQHESEPLRQNTLDVIEELFDSDVDNENNKNLAILLYRYERNTSVEYLRRRARDMDLDAAVVLAINKDPAVEEVLVDIARKLYSENSTLLQREWYPGYQGRKAASRGAEVRDRRGAFIAAMGDWPGVGTEVLADMLHPLRSRGRDAWAPLAALSRAPHDLDPDVIQWLEEMRRRSAVPSYVIAPALLSLERNDEALLREVVEGLRGHPFREGGTIARRIAEMRLEEASPVLRNMLNVWLEAETAQQRSTIPNPMVLSLALVRIEEEKAVPLVMEIMREYINRSTADLPEVPELVYALHQATNGEIDADVSQIFEDAGGVMPQYAEHLAELMSLRPVPHEYLPHLSQRILHKHTQLRMQYSR